mgnify:CR=1 FL=1|jgi:Skp family chaperone for outer membrane proteins
MKIKQLLVLAITAASFLGNQAWSMDMQFGFVETTKCLDESLVGISRTKTFENTKKQYDLSMEENESQLRELIEKRNDVEYMDSLSPEGEKELEMQIYKAHEQKSATQNKFSMILNRISTQMNSMFFKYFKNASQVVAEKNKLAFILDGTQCPFYKAELDKTSEVIAQMDILYSEEIPQEEQTILEGAQ